MSSGVRKAKKAAMAPPLTRAPPLFGQWVTMVVGLVTAGNGHAARWLVASHANSVKSIDLVENIYPTKAGPASEMLTTVSVLAMLPTAAGTAPQRHANNLAHLKGLGTAEQAALGLTVVGYQRDSRTHGARSHKLVWVGPCPADGVSAPASPGDCLMGKAPGAAVALCEGGHGQGRAKRGMERPLKDASHANLATKKACTVHKDATATAAAAAAAGPAAAQTKTNNPKRKSQEAHQKRHREAVLAPVEALLDGPHGAAPRAATADLSKQRIQTANARLEATVNVVAAMNGVPRDITDPEDEKRAAATLALLARQWGVSPASLIAAASPGHAAIAVTAETLAEDLYRNPGWTLTTLGQHIKSIDKVLNPMQPGQKRRSRKRPRKHPVPNLADVRAHLLALPRPNVQSVAHVVPGSEPHVGKYSVAMDAKAYLEALLGNPSTQATTHHNLFAGSSLIVLVGMDGAQVTKSGNISVILTTLGLLNQAGLNHSVPAAPPLAMCPVPESRGAMTASLRATFDGLVQAKGELEWPCPGLACAKCRAGDPPDCHGNHTAKAHPFYCLDMKAVHLAFGTATNACPWCTKKISQLTNDRMIAPDFDLDREFPLPTTSQRRDHAASHAEALQAYVVRAHPDPERRPNTTTISVADFELSPEYAAWANGAGREGIASGGVLLESITSMWQITPDALHILLYLGRVICQELAQMMRSVEHDLAATHGAGIGYVMGIRALYLSGMTRAAYIMEVRYRGAATTSGKGINLGSSAEGLPLDNRRVRAQPPPPLDCGCGGREGRAIRPGAGKEKGGIPGACCRRRPHLVGRQPGSDGERIDARVNQGNGFNTPHYFQ